MSWQSILPVIYSFFSCFCIQFDLLERNFCTRYPFVSLFFWFKIFWPFWNVFGTYWSFFWWISCQIDSGVIYSSPFPSFWDRYPFCWVFFWFKQWDFRQFWHISSALLEVFFWMTCPINLRVIYPYSYWRANFEVTILFCDFSLGSKSDILGSYGTFTADIAGFFLNELANHFRSKLILFFLFLRSIWPTGELILRSPSFSLTFFLVQKLTFQAVLAHF